MAAIDAVDGGDLLLDAGVPTRGNLRPHQPDQTRGRLWPSNIAEGQGRLSPGEFRQFLSIARGSICEVQTQLEIARALQFGKPALLNEAESLSHEVGKMIFAFLESIKDQAPKN